MAARRRPRPLTRRGRSMLAAATSAVLGAALLTLLPTSGAQADTAPIAPVTTPTVSADVLPTVQVNGVVWSQVTIGNRVYATGSFTSARPAGAAAGTNETPRSNILAFDVTTGALISSWAPSLNAQGLGIAASSDGRSVFVVGDFTTVNGATRRRAAQIDATTGALVATFNPNPDSQARAVAVNGDTVYIGGSFSVAGGQARSRLAAFSASTGALTAWAPAADQNVYAITAPAGSTRVVVGGRFTTLNGTAARGSGAVDATTGATLPFPANQVAYDYGPDAAIYSLTTDGTNVYATGYNYLVNGNPASGGNFESVFAASVATGDLVWISGCRGDTYSAAVVAGVVYSVSHAHDCSSIGGHPQTNPWTFQRAMAFQAAPAADGRVNDGGNFSGRPAPELLHWFPTITTGTVTGQGQGAWSVTGNSQYVVLGGEFPTINGVAQQGLARFAVSTVAPNKQGPQGSSELTPTVVSLESGRVRVSWTAAYDRDNRRLSYELLRGSALSSATVVATLTQDSAWFRRPSMFAIDQSAPVGSSQTYRVRVKDAFGNTVVGPTTTATIPAGGTRSVYSTAVLDDGATHLWRLAEAGGTVGYDYASADDLVLGTPVTRAADGAMVNDATAKATTFSGTATVPGTTTSAVPAPQTFAEELWFRTTTTSGGKLLGFGNSSTGTSNNYDRHLYLTNSGTLTFGVYPNAVRTLTSGKAYNDGQWHHVVANLGSGGTELWVDGKRIARDAGTTAAQSFSGYWRIGGDNLSGWPGQPASTAFAGSIEDVAVYPAPLTQAQVQAHYTASGRTLNVPTRPTDAYGAAVWDASPSFYWRLDDAAASPTALDRMTNTPTGAYGAGVVRGEAGAPANAAGSAIRLPAAGTQAVVSTTPVTNPTAWTEETWFRTTTTTGGRIIGFGDSSDPAGTSSNYDRYVYMLDDGTLRFGVWTGSPAVVSSPGAYNDGAWHHLAASSGPDGMRLYVDGVQVASGPAVTPQSYTGYWRLGTDNTWGGAGSNTFAGSLDEAAVYDQVLPAATISQHAQLGKPAAPNTPPTAAFTSSSAGLVASLDGTGSTDSDGTVAGWAWQFGDGATGTGSTATHTYAAAGTYTVVLTVTDDKGATATVSHAVTVTQPPNVLPKASFTSSTAKLKATFDGSGSSDADGTVVGYAWDFGDGSSGSGVAPSHTYAGPGSYTVALTVTDDRAGTATTSKQVTVVANVAPSAGFGTSCTDLSCTFDGTASTDSDGTISSYAWTFGDGTTGTGAKPAHTYAAAGSYTVTLIVTDNDGATGTTTKQIGVTKANVAPTASFTSSCTALACALDGSASADPDGTVTGYAWDFGDGSTGTGTKPAHTYAAGGAYTVVLTVTDDKGATGTTSKVVTVTAPNQPPTASFTASCSGLTCSFDAAAAKDPDGSVVAYAWAFGDGTSGSGATASHTYAAGTYTVTLTVTDDKGATGSTTRSISPAAPVNQPPTASFTATPSGRTVAVDGTGSTDADGSVVSWSWAFGDGAAGTGATATHDYAADGTYDVTLTVKDDAGATTSATKKVTVTGAANQPPTAAFTASCTNLGCSLDASSSGDADGSIVSYAWAFGDGGSGTGVSPTHTYPAAGTYSVVLTVTDDKGATGSLTRAVTVTAPSATAASDAFARTVASGLGTADLGGPWTVSGSKAAWSVDGSAAKVAVQPGATGSARLAGVSILGSDVTSTLWTEAMPTGGGAYLSTIARGTAAGDYTAVVKILSTGAVTVNVSRTGATIGSTVTVPGLTYSAGTRLRVRVQATGSAPTTLRAKVWLAGSAEPAGWTVTATDNTAGYQVAGSVGFSHYLSGSATTALVVRDDDLVVTNTP